MMVVSVIVISSIGGTIGISFIFPSFGFGSGGGGVAALGFAVAFFGLETGFLAFDTTFLADALGTDFFVLDLAAIFFALALTTDFLAFGLMALFLAFLGATFFEVVFFFNGFLEGLAFFPAAGFDFEAFLGFCFFLVAIVFQIYVGRFVENRTNLKAFDLTCANYLNKIFAIMPILAGNKEYLFLKPNNTLKCSKTKVYW
jgi:hypothetical protein